jgi:hypothetical protein
LSASHRTRFLGLVGFPRSGTTVLAALLDAHDDVCMYYEPWNASAEQRPAPPESLAAFREQMEQRFGFGTEGASVVGFKETVTYTESREYAVRTIDNVAREAPVHVVWIFRDPIHCLFSKLEGARKWWGNPEAHFSREVLERYMRESRPHLEALTDLVGRQGGVIVSYAALAKTPEETLRGLMDELGLVFDSAQLDYYKAGARPGVVMGDPDVRERPAPVSSDSRVRREREAAEHRTVIDKVMADPEFDWLRSEFARLAALPDVAPVKPAE